MALFRLGRRAVSTFVREEGKWWRSPYKDIDKAALELTNVAEFVTQRWETYAAEGRTAIIDEHGGSRSYKELLDGVSRSAGALQEAGISKGDTVAIVSPNAVDYSCAALATMRLNAAVSPANPMATPGELVRQMANACAKMVITHPRCIDVVLEAVDRSEGAIQTVVCLGGEDDVPASARGKGVVPFDTWRLESPLKVTHCVGGNDGHHLSVLPYSSGTTGLPKGVALSHANLVANIMQIGPHEMEMPGPLICPLPMFHIYAFTVALLAPLFYGKTLITMADRFDLPTFCSLVQTYRPSRAYLVPPIVLALAKQPVVDQYDFSSLKMIVSAAAPLDGALERACKERLGVDVKQAWGVRARAHISLPACRW